MVFVIEHRPDNLSDSLIRLICECGFFLSLGSKYVFRDTFKRVVTLNTPPVGQSLDENGGMNPLSGFMNE